MYELFRGYGFKHVSIIVTSLIATAVTTIPSQSQPQEQTETKALTLDQQNALLRERVTSKMVTNSFIGSASTMKNAGEPWMSTTDQTIAKTRVKWVFPPSYQPTRAEVFEMLARQSGASAKYSGLGKAWQFEKPAMPEPYTMKIADGWRKDDLGMRIIYSAPSEGSSMVVTMCGRYSQLSPDQLKTIREKLAMTIAEAVDKNIEPSAMKVKTIDGCDALYFESPVPQTTTVWRQWAFVKNNEGFILGAALNKPDESKLLPELEKMVASFHVLDPAPAFPGI